MRGVLFRPTTADHQVTTLELFFDLVFVFAFTQVTQLMADDPTVAGLSRGLLLLALLWWAWCSYAWLGNQAQADEGVVRVTLVVAMTAVFVGALAIPEAFDDLPGGLSAALVLAVCFTVVRLAHLACYLVAAGSNVVLRRRIVAMAVPVVVAATILIIGALLDPAVQTLIWLAALVIDYVGIWLASGEGWELRSPTHFAERHGLIVLIAIGESLVAIGVGVAGVPISWPVVLGAVVGVAISTALWWLYFDVVAPAAEQVLVQARGLDRVRLARTSYTYWHFPIVVSIVLIALGLKKALEHVSDIEHHHLDEPLAIVPLTALLGGAAVYLLGHVGLRYRNLHTWNPHRTVAAAVCLALIPILAPAPALTALIGLAVVLLVLVGYEVVRFGPQRAALRSHHAGSPADG